jgi:transcriptional regulator with XRE-family HTH domain
MVGLMMPLKDRVRELRKAAGLTQQALAVKAGVSVSVVQHIEQGAIPDPRVSTLVQLARAMGVPLDALVEDGGEPAPEKPKGKGKGKK